MGSELVLTESDFNEHQRHLHMGGLCKFGLKAVGACVCVPFRLLLAVRGTSDLDDNVSFFASSCSPCEFMCIFISLGPGQCAAN